jgi:hypothetical protein
MSGKLIKIEGRKYNADMLKYAEQCKVSGNVVSKEEAAKLFCVAMDAGKLTESELDTFEYIKKNFDFTKPAKQELSFLIEQALAAAKIVFE